MKYHGQTRDVDEKMTSHYDFTYDFSTLYITLSHNLIKEKLINLIEWTFKREGSPYIACNERQAFFTSGDKKR